jgi:hypothetical protein
VRPCLGSRADATALVVELLAQVVPGNGVRELVNEQSIKFLARLTCVRVHGCIGLAERIAVDSELAAWTECSAELPPGTASERHMDVRADRTQGGRFSNQYPSSAILAARESLGVH